MHFKYILVYFFTREEQLSTGYNRKCFLNYRPYSEGEKQRATHFTTSLLLQYSQSTPQLVEITSTVESKRRVET